MGKSNFVLISQFEDISNDIHTMGWTSFNKPCKF